MRWWIPESPWPAMVLGSEPPVPTVYGVTKCWMQLSDWVCARARTHTHIYTHTHIKAFRKSKELERRHGDKNSKEVETLGHVWETENHAVWLEKLSLGDKQPSLMRSLWGFSEFQHRQHLAQTAAYWSFSCFLPPQPPPRHRHPCQVGVSEFLEHWLAEDRHFLHLKTLGP